MRKYVIENAWDSMFEITVNWCTGYMTYQTSFFSLYKNELKIKSTTFTLREWDSVYKWKRMLYKNKKGQTKTSEYLTKLLKK